MNVNGKIINPIGLKGKVISEIEVRTNFAPTLNVNYLANSLSPSLFTKNKIYFLDNLSAIKDLIFKPVPLTFGNTSLENASVTNVPLLEFDLNENGVLIDTDIFSNKPMEYVDDGKSYLLYSSDGESNNFLGWQPLSSEDKFIHIERSDVCGFDYPEFTINGTRKIPKNSGDTMCGPYSVGYNHSNYNWFFGNHAGINFTPIITGGTPTNNPSQLVSQEGCSTISSKEGELLFFTDGNTVYNRNNQVMKNGNNLSSSGTSTQSSIIIPQNNQKYFIFTTDFEGNPNGFEYSCVDMSLESGLGEVTIKNNKLINNSISEKVTSFQTPVNYGSKYSVITHSSGDSKFYVYMLDSNGLNTGFTVSTGYTYNSSRGYMKTSLDGKKIISLLYDENVIQILDIDNYFFSLNPLQNEILLTGITFDNGPYGLEYSSDSSKFYVSDGASEKIIQFDLSYSSSTEMINNMIEVASVSGSSLGALQMGPDNKIYVSDYGKEYLHIIHNPNGKGVECNFQERGMILTGVTEIITSTGTTSTTGITSTWGLPNSVTTSLLCCDRFIYVSERNKENFNFDIIMNDKNEVISSKELNFTAEIYPYDNSISAFTNNNIYNQSFNYSEFSGKTTLNIPLNQINEGEFIIKGYFEYPAPTLIQNKLGNRINTLNNYKRGTEYNLYNPKTDWYFLNMYVADTPLIVDNSVINASTIPNLKEKTNVTKKGDRYFGYRSLSEPIVAYNGVILTKGLEYSANTTDEQPVIDLFIPTLDDQILTLIYVDEGNSDNLTLDSLKIVDPIITGLTNEQGDNKIYYNFTESKYEYYLPIRPQGDLVVVVNGQTLSKDIDYLRSSSDLKRIIFEQNIKIGDLIQIFYVPLTGVFGPLQTNTPTLSWSINNAPTQGQGGRFSVQVVGEKDNNFENVLYSKSTDYVLEEKVYSVNMDFTNASAGTKLLYRIKNEKFYQPIVGEIISSVSYSETIPIEIITNKGNNY